MKNLSKLKIIAIVIFNLSLGFAYQNKAESLFIKLINPIEAEVSSTIAVLPFKVSTSAFESSMGTVIAEYGVETILNRSKLTMVDRIHFKETVTELKLSQIDLIDKESALELGKLLSAKYLIMGNISSIDGRHLIQASLVATQTSQTLFAITDTLISESFLSLKNEIFSERTQVSSVMYRSALGPGWGQFYAGKPWHGYITSLSFFAALGYGIYTGIELYNRDADVQYFSPIEGRTLSSEMERLKKIENKRDLATDRLVAAAWLLSGIWVLNLADAAWVGINQSQKFKELYFSLYFPSQNLKHSGLMLTLNF